MRIALGLEYHGTPFHGWQSQADGSAVQNVLERALSEIARQTVAVVAAGRTDTGVHALQNFFHFDFEGVLNPQFVYKINAILPGDIVVKSIFPVTPAAHCRFDAISREYKYYIYRQKDPFLRETAFYFPYKLDMEKLRKAAELVKHYHDFTSFSKRNTQVKTFVCQIETSEWLLEKGCLVYHVKGNRFLRGMVRALTATMLKAGRGTIDIEEFIRVIEAKDCTQASFAVPPHGLFLTSVEYSSEK